MNELSNLPAGDDESAGRGSRARRRKQAGGQVPGGPRLGRDVDPALARTKPLDLSEAAIQSQVRSYLAALGIDAIHVPNGTHLAGDAKARAMQTNALKKAGVLPGFADLIIFDRRVRRVGFLEVKARKGVISPAQEAFAQLATGVWMLPYAVVRSVDDVQATLHEWGWRS